MKPLPLGEAEKTLELIPGSLRVPGSWQHGMRSHQQPELGYVARPAGQQVQRPHNVENPAAEHCASRGTRGMWTGVMDGLGLLGDRKGTDNELIFIKKPALVRNVT